MHAPRSQDPADRPDDPVVPVADPSAPVVTQTIDPVPPTGNGNGHGLGRTAARGAVVTLSAQGLKIIIQVVGVVVLARMLLPGDYGLVAMVTSIVGVAEIFRDFGLSAAAIQSKSLSRGQRTNLFWINTAAGAVLTAMIMLGAPLIALVYHRGELVDVARWLAPVFLLNGMATQYRASLTRNLKFRHLASVEVTAPAIALAASILVASQGGGYWALVVQQLSTAALLLILLVIVSRWLPGLFDRTAPMRDLLRFGWNLAGSQLIGYIANNVDSLTIGIRLGPTSLGLYNRAFQLLMTPLAQVRTPTTTVALPILSRLKDSQSETDRFVQRGQLGLGLTLVAGLGLIIGAADPVTEIFLGERWAAVSPILRLLAAAGIFQTLAFVGYWVYLSHGLTKELFHYSFLSAAIKIVLIVGGSQWGLMGVAWGYALAPAVTWPLSFWWLSRKSTIHVKPLFVGAGRIMLLVAWLAGTTAVVSWLTAPLGSWLQLLLAVVSAVTAYALILCVPIYRRDVLSVIRLVRQGMSRR